MIISFFGHADFNRQSEFEQALLDCLENTVKDNDVELFLGGYGAFDRFCYSCCKKFKKSHPRAKIIFVSPYLSSKHLQNIKQDYDLIIFPEIENIPPKLAIMYRNKYMVEKSDFIITYVERTYGGAYKAYKYAKKLNKSILNFGELKSTQD